MKCHGVFTFIALASLPALFRPPAAAAASPSEPQRPQSAALSQTVVVRVDTAHPGASLPRDFIGLSFEASQLLPDANGLRYFRPGNKPLLNLFRTLGIRSLRIGGNSSDRDANHLPDRADLDSLFAFAKAANVKVIYCLRLLGGNPSADAQTAKYIMDRYAAQMACFSIGQEPSAYKIAVTNAPAAGGPPTVRRENYPYSLYAANWKSFENAIVAAAPNAEFCGPSVHKNGKWAVDFMRDFGRPDHVTLITEHLYPGGAGNKVPSPAIGIDRMLSPRFTRVYQSFYDSFVPAALSNGLPCRLEEVNNYYNGGAAGVSDTFAAALWGLHFMHWWAAHGAAGLNFHTGDKVAAGHSLRPSKYTAFFTSENGFNVRPLGYGIKAFDLGGHGKILPVHVQNLDTNLNLAAYGVLGRDAVYVTLINQGHGPVAHGSRLAIVTPRARWSRAEILYLLAPDNNVAATSGETLGNSAISNRGKWNGSWRPLPIPSQRASVPIFIAMPPSSAAIVKLIPSKPVHP
ncbi:MAG: hypothetical protein KGJ88_02590 [Verrucomicrobiota bacterium]|nr:hypothetical protein [Verrucomicrobiota bacterium]